MFEVTAKESLQTAYTDQCVSYITYSKSILEEDACFWKYVVIRVLQHIMLNEWNWSDEITHHLPLDV